MQLFTPAQLEAFTGLKVINQRVWHREGYFHPWAESERERGAHRAGIP